MSDDKPKYLNFGQIAPALEVSRQYLFQIFARDSITENESRLLKRMISLLESDRKALEKKMKKIK